MYEIRDKLPDLETALEVFVNAFARARSVISPAEAVMVGTLRVVRDVPGHRRVARGQEIMVPATMDVDEALAIVQDYSVSATVCVLRTSPVQGKSAVAAMKRSGYRFLRSEPMMVRSTSTPSRPSTGSLSIGRVADSNAAAAVAKFAGGRQLTEKDLSAGVGAIRVYAAWIDGEVVCFARSVPDTADCSYLAGMFTKPAVRRRGIATAVLFETLAADARDGLTANVLLASRSGEQLYLSMGYTTIGDLYIFAPVKPKRDQLPAAGRN